MTKKSGKSGNACGRLLISIPFIVILVVTTVLYAKTQGEVNGVNLLSQLKDLKERMAVSKTRNLTFVVMCGKGDVDTVEELRPLVVSAVLMTSCPLHFIFVADAPSAEKADTIFREELRTMIKPVTVEIWTISPRFIATWATNFKFSIAGHAESKRVWLIGKLYIPYLLQQYEQIVVIDSDMIFLDDPAVLWDEFDDNTGAWAYKMPMNDMSSENSICSCVVLINVRNVLSNKLYPTKFHDALALDRRRYNRTTGLYRTERVDQAVYYLLRKNRPDLFRSLDQRFNVDHCHYYYGVLRQKSQARATILHLNCPEYRFKDKALGDIFFNFYRVYKWSWLRGEKGRNFSIDIKRFEDDESAAFTRFNLTRTYR